MADDGPLLVQVNLRVRGTQVRVQTVTTSVDDLSPALTRLEGQIVRLGADWRPRTWPDPTRPMLSVGAEESSLAANWLYRSVPPRCRRRQ